MKRNKYFIALIDQIHNFRKFVTVMAFTAKDAAVTAVKQHKPEGYDTIESVVRIA